MKQIRKISCLLLALMMVLSLGITAFASGTETGDGGTTPSPVSHSAEGPETLGEDASGNPKPNNAGVVNITNARKNETYSLYQILTLQSYTIPNNAEVDQTTGNVLGGMYSYAFNSVWSDFIDHSVEATNNGITTTYKASDYLSVDGNGVVKWKGEDTNDRAAALAMLALDYADKKNIQPVKTVTTTDTDTTVSFSGLKLGYYLVDTTVGTLCSLNTTNTTTNMEDKNKIPQLNKQVREGTDENFSAENTVKIGSTVDFQVEVTFGPGAQDLVFHDTMGDGLNLLPNTIKIYKEATMINELEQGTGDDQLYTIDTSGTAMEGDDSSKPCTFHISFTDAFRKKTINDTKYYIFYQATVDEDAVVVENGTNTAKFSYGENHNFTSETTTKTHTWEIPVVKYTTNSDGSLAALAGAKFVLKAVEPTKDGQNPKVEPDITEGAIQVILDGKKKYTEKYKEGEKDMTREREYDVYRVATQAEIDAGTPGIIKEIETGETGRFRIQGLDAGHYQLWETAAPAGYDPLKTPIQIEIQEDGKVLNNNAQQDVISVKNGTGTRMPSTGGIGTTIFYVVGSVLLIGAGVLLVTKKRMSVQ